MEQTGKFSFRRKTTSHITVPRDDTLCYMPNTCLRAFFISKLFPEKTKKFLLNKLVNMLSVTKKRKFNFELWMLTGCYLIWCRRLLINSLILNTSFKEQNVLQIFNQNWISEKRELITLYSEKIKQSNGQYCASLLRELHATQWYKRERYKKMFNFSKS